MARSFPALPPPTPALRPLLGFRRTEETAKLFFSGAAEVSLLDRAARLAPVNSYADSLQVWMFLTTTTGCSECPRGR